MSSGNLLDGTTRVILGSDDQWVDVKPLTVDELRSMRAVGFAAEMLPGEEKLEAQGFEVTKAALNKCITAWSDDAPVSPENIARLPYKMTLKIAQAVGLGDEEVPLEDGSASTEA